MRSNADPYCYPGTDVLVNRLGLRDADKLQQAEGHLSGLRMAQLQLSPLAGSFDLAHLSAIHRFIFQDLYEWAGKPRTVDIAKGGSVFALHPFIITAAADLFSKMRADEQLRRGVPIDVFTTRLAHYFGEINALHPYREGNGRSQREFVRLFGRSRGFKIAWRKIDRDMMMGASIEAMSGHTATMAALLRIATTIAQTRKPTRTLQATQSR